MSKDLAETYHRLSEWEYSCGAALLRSLDIAPGARILELGSATGRLAIDAAHFVAPDGEVLCLEPSEERFQVARRFYRAGNVTFHMGRPHDLSAFGEGAVDLVYSNLLLHRLKEPSHVFEATLKALKPGGVFSFTCLLSRPSLIDALEMMIFSHPEFAPFRDRASGLETWFLRNLEEWAALVRSSGFAKISFHSLATEMSFGSPSELMAYWEAATEGLFLRGLTDLERNAVCVHVDEQFSSLWGGRPIKAPAEVAAFRTAKPL